MKFRKRKKIIKREKAALVKGEKIPLIQEVGIPSGKLNIKIFSASKYTPAYSPLGFAPYHSSKTDDPRVEFNIQTEERQPVPQVNELESWQEVVVSANLSVRATNVLLKNFSSYEKFLASNEDSFRDLRNCGRKTVKELIEFRNAIAQREPGQPGAEVSIRPKTAEEALRLPPFEENIQFLPVFSSRPVVDFVVHDLHPDFYGAIPLKDFVFSARASKILKKLGLKTIGEVMLFPAGELLTQKNFGRKCLREVQNIIHSFISAGGISQSAAMVSEGRSGLSETDFSSYENLVASFARHCLKSKRNQAIMCGRLDFSGGMPTLEQLGERFGLTRERVRQILKRGNALLRIKAHRELLKDFWESVSQIISKGGGIISLHDLSDNLQKKYNWSDSPNPAALAELLSVAEEEKAFSSSEDTVTVPCSCLSCEVPGEFLSTLDFEANESYHILVTGDKLVRYCQKRCRSTFRLQKFHKAFIKKMVDDSNGRYQLNEELIFLYDCWLIRHGERLEDLIVHVFEKHGKPMHFSEIAAAIRKTNIKHHEISDHNVHAAMMRYDSIEITNRGTYGLKIWGAGGYRSVSTAIEELLDAHDQPMRRSDIIKQLAGEFSAQNISTALYNRSSRFESIGEGYYVRPERWRKRSVTEFIEMLPAPTAELALGPEVIQKLTDVLSSHFTNGYRLNSLIEMARFRSFAAEDLGEEITLTDEELRSYIAACGTTFDGKVYAVSAHAKERIKDLSEDYFADGAQAIFFAEFYAKNENWLFEASVVSEDMLIDILRCLFPNLSFTQTYFGYTDASVFAALECEILRVWGDEVLLTYGQLAERLRYIPLERIKSVLGQNGDFIWSSVETFSHVSRIEITDEERQVIHQAAVRECNARGYASITDLPSGEIEKRNYELSITAVHNAVYRICLANKFDKKGKIIARKGEVFDALTIIKEYCRTIDKCSLDDLLIYEKELTGEVHRWIPMEAGNTVLVRIDKNTYVADKYVHFNADIIDEAIGLFVKGDYLTLKSFITFGAFPDCGQTWNLFLLESYCRRFSRKFRFDTPSVNSRNAGAVICKSCGMDYTEIMTDAVANADVPLKDTAVGKFLYESGYTGRSTTAKVNEIIDKAKAIREKRD